MNNKKMKGFTIVELVIVIAIIAILAAILIPTFASIIDRANESSDIQAARQMNSALAQESVLASPSEIDSVIIILGNAGYNTQEKLRPVSAGYNFYWYKTYNQILLVEEAEDEDDTARLVYPTDNETLSETFGGHIVSSVAQMNDTADKELFNLATFTDALLYSPVEKGLVSGGVVTLTKDEEISNTLVLTNNTTLDLNGQTLTINGNGAFIIEKSFDIVGNGNVIISEAIPEADPVLASFAKALFMNPMLKESSASIDLGINALFTGAVSKGSSSTMDGGSSNPVSGRFTIKGGRLTFGKDENDSINLKLPGDNIFCIQNNGGTLIINQCTFTNGDGSTMTVTGDTVTVTLAQNIDFGDDMLTIPAEKDVKISGGAGITLKAKFNVLGNLTFDGKLTVDMLSITIGENGALSAQGGVEITCTSSNKSNVLEVLFNNPNVTLSNCTVDGIVTTEDADGKRVISVSANTIITSLTVHAGKTVEFQLNGGKLTFEDQVEINGTLMITGSGAVSASTQDITFAVNEGGKLEISGTSATNKITVSVQNLDNKSVSVAEGESFAYSNCDFCVSNDYADIYDNGNSIIVDLKQNVLIETGTNITKNVTINLNGKTLTIGSVTVNGQLTINGAGIVDAGAFSVSGSGKVKIEDANVYTGNTDPLRYVLEKVLDTDSNVTYEGCTFDNGNSSAQVTNGQIELNGAFDLADLAINQEITLVAQNGETVTLSGTPGGSGTLNISGGGIAVSADVLSRSTGVINLDGVTVKTGKSPLMYLLESVVGNSKLNVANCNFENNNDLIIATVANKAITLTDDSTIADGATIQSEQTATINLNGHTLTINKIDNNATLTVNGMLTINGSGTETIGGQGTITNNGTLSISNAIVSCAISNNGASTIANCTVSGAISNSGTLEINGGSVTGTISGEGTLKVSGTAITGDTSLLNSLIASNKVTLTSCTFNGMDITKTGANVTIKLNDASDLSGLEIPADVTAMLDLNGKTLNLSSGIIVRGTLYVSNKSNTTAYINTTSDGYTFSVENNAILNLGYQTIGTIEITVSPRISLGIINNGGKSIVIGNACLFKNPGVQIVYVNDKTIEATLLDNVKLESLVTVTRNVTIKLNGHTLTLSGDASFSGTGTLTIEENNTILGNIGVLNRLINCDLTINGYFWLGDGNIKLNRSGNVININLENNTCDLSGLAINESKDVTITGTAPLTLSSLGTISGSLEINNVRVNGTDAILSQFLSESNLILTNCTFNEMKVSENESGAIIDLEGGEISLSNISFEGSLTIKNGEIKGNLNTLLSDGLMLNACTWNEMTIAKTSSRIDIGLNSRALSLANISFKGSFYITGEGTVDATNITASNFGSLTISNASITGNLSAFLNNSNLSLNNCTWNETTVTEGDVVTITLNGHTFSLDGITISGTWIINGAGYITATGCSFEEGAELTIKDATINGDNVLNDFLNITGLSLVNCNHNGLIIDKNDSETIITLTRETTFESFVVSGSITINLNGNKLVENNNAFTIEEGGILTIKDTSESGGGSINVSAADSFSLNGGVMILGEGGNKIVVNCTEEIFNSINDSSYITFSNCEFVTENFKIYVDSNGNIIATVTGEYADGIPGGYIEVYGNVTVDLGGKTLIADSIVNRGTLSFENGIVSVNATGNKEKAINNYGTLSISELNATVSGASAYGVYSNMGECTVASADIMVTGDTATGIYVQGGAVTLTNMTISVTGNGARGIYNKSELELSNSSITLSAQYSNITWEYSYILYASASAKTALINSNVTIFRKMNARGIYNMGELSINGGVFTATQEQGATGSIEGGIITGEGNASKITVNGITINANNLALTNFSYSAPVYIAGGTLHLEGATINFAPGYCTATSGYSNEKITLGEGNNFTYFSKPHFCLPCGKSVDNCAHYGNAATLESLLSVSNNVTLSGATLFASELTISSDTTINLNGQSLSLSKSAKFLVNGATLTIIGNGNLDLSDELASHFEVTNGGKVVFGDSTGTVAINLPSSLQPFTEIIKASNNSGFTLANCSFGSDMTISYDENGMVLNVNKNFTIIGAIAIENDLTFNVPDGVTLTLTVAEGDPITVNAPLKFMGEGNVVISNHYTFAGESSIEFNGVTVNIGTASGDNHPFKDRKVKLNNVTLVATNGRDDAWALLKYLIETDTIAATACECNIIRASYLATLSKVENKAKLSVTKDVTWNGTIELDVPIIVSEKLVIVSESGESAECQEIILNTPESEVDIAGTCFSGTIKGAGIVTVSADSLGTITLNGVIIKGSEELLIALLSNEKVTLTNCTFNFDGYSVTVNKSSTAISITLGNNVTFSKVYTFPVATEINLNGKDLKLGRLAEFNINSTSLSFTGSGTIDASEAGSTVFLTRGTLSVANGITVKGNETIFNNIITASTSISIDLFEFGSYTVRIENVIGGRKLTLLSNVTLFYDIEINQSYPLTIDLGGYTLDLTGIAINNEKGALSIVGSGTLKAYNASFVTEGYLHIEGVTITSSFEKDSLELLKFFITGSNVTMTDVTFDSVTLSKTKGVTTLTVGEGKSFTLNFAVNGELTITGGGTISIGSLFSISDGSLTIDGMNIDGDYSTLGTLIETDRLTIRNTTIKLDENNSVTLTKGGSGVTIGVTKDTAIDSLTITGTTNINVADDVTLTVSTLNVNGKLTVIGGGTISIDNILIDNILIENTVTLNGVKVTCPTHILGKFISNEKVTITSSTFTVGSNTMTVTKNGNDVKLTLSGEIDLSDVTLNISGNLDVTGNGTLVLSSTSINGFTLSNLTVGENVTVSGSTSLLCELINSGVSFKSFQITDGAKVEVTRSGNNVTINIVSGTLDLVGENLASINLIVNLNGGTLDIDGANLEGINLTVNLNDGTLDLSSGKLTVNSLTVNGSGSLDIGVRVDITDFCSVASVTLNDVTVTGDGIGIDTLIAMKNADYTITRCSFNNFKASVVDGIVVLAADYSGSLGNLQETEIDLGGHTLTSSSLSNAIIKNGTVVVNGDLSILANKSLTLINVNVNVSGNLTNYGTITVNGGSLTVNALNNHGTITVNGGSLTASAVLTNYGNCKITATNATVSVRSIDNKGTFEVNTSTVTVNGTISNTGAISGNGTTFNFTGSGTDCFYNNGQVNITNVTITVTGSYSYIVYSANATTTISGTYSGVSNVAHNGLNVTVNVSGLTKKS